MKFKYYFAGCLMLFAFGTAHSTLITFDDAVGGTSYSFDDDGDGVGDVIFSTTDPSGFNNVGPGPNMSFVQEPGLEGTTLLDTDMRIDFLSGAIDLIEFSFGLNENENPNENSFAEIEIYDTGGILLGSAIEFAQFTLFDGVNRSTFPEGILSIAFSGVASFALLNFSNSSSGGQRYIMDNFMGTFGARYPKPDPDPEPGPDPKPIPISQPTIISLIGLGLIILGFINIRKSRSYSLAS